MQFFVSPDKVSPPLLVFEHFSKAINLFYNMAIPQYIYFFEISNKLKSKSKNESTFRSDSRGRQWDNEFEGVSLKIRLLVQTPSGNILG